MPISPLQVLLIFLISVAFTCFIVWLCEKVPRTTRKLYVDDVRPCPEGWEVARSFHEAIVMLEDNHYDEVSLDHDIASFYGNKEMTGYDVLQYLIMKKMDGHPVPRLIHVHSANPVGVKKMQEDIDRHW